MLPTATLRLQPPSVVFSLFSRTLRFTPKGSSRFMPKLLWQSCYMVPNHKSIHQPRSQNWTPFTTRSYAKFSKSKVHIVIGFWTPLALIAPTTSCCNRLLPKYQVSCSPVSWCPKNAYSILATYSVTRPALSTIYVSITHFLSVPSRHHFAVVPQEHTGQKLP